MSLLSEAPELDLSSDPDFSDADLSDSENEGEGDYPVTIMPAKADAQPMTMALKRRLKSTEYLARARESYALAEASSLAQVRERHEAAGLRWTELAGQQDAAGDDADRRAI